MKYITNTTIILFLSICCIALFTACGGDTTEGEATTTAHSHDGHDHSGHDHSGHNHNHAHDHSGHNHNHAHDHSGHDHSGHSHAKSERKEDSRSRSKVSQKRQEELRKLFEEAKTQPATAEQKATAKEICDCLNKVPEFSKIVACKNIEELRAAIGQNNLTSAKAFQDCHNTIMPTVIRKLGDEGGIYAYKAREVINQTCLKDNASIWLHVGRYIAENRSPAASVPNNLKQLQVQKAKQ